MLLKLAANKEALENVQEECLSTLFEMQRMHLAQEKQVQKLPIGIFTRPVLQNLEPNPMETMQGNQS